MKEKLLKLLSDGTKKLQFVFDFDNTMNLNVVSGVKVRSMVSILEMMDLMPGYKEEADKLVAHYYQFHNRKDLHPDEVFRLSYEWMDKTVKLLIKYGLTKEMVQDIVSSEFMQLRKDIIDILEFANLKKIAVIIFSANTLGSEAILLVLRKFKVDFPNIQIVSNKLLYAENGVFSGYEDDYIHSENKKWELLERKIVDPKKNTILFGDGHGDAHMVEGENVFRVAVLDQVPHAKSEDYLNVFDCVTTEEGHFSLYKILSEMQAVFSRENRIGIQK